MGEQLDRLRVIALAGGLLSYLPQPRQASQLLGASGVSAARVVPCSTCGARGRLNEKREPCAGCVPRVGPQAPPVHRPRHGCVPCLVCSGTGWRPRRKADAGVDEYVGEPVPREQLEQNVGDLLLELARGLGTKEGHRAREVAARRQDNLMVDLAYQRGETDDPKADVRWVEERRWLFRGGSFADLAAAIDSLRDAMPARASQWWRRYVLEERFQADAVAAVALVETTDWIVLRMPRPIIVPAHLEPETVNADRKDSLWRGRTVGHRRQRAERDRHIRQLRADGWSFRRIGRLYQLDAARIKRICDTATVPHQ